MIDLEQWIDQTFAWIKSEPGANPTDQDSASTAPNVADGEQVIPHRDASRSTKPPQSFEIPPQFDAPEQLDWPLDLLQKLPQFIEVLFAENRDIDQTAKRVDLVIQNLSVWLQQYLSQLRKDVGVEAAFLTQTSDEIVIGAARLYRELQPFHAFRSEEVLLRLMLAVPSEQSIPLWISLMVDLPPTNHRSAAAGVETLTQRRGLAADSLFPALVGALDNPTTIAPVLDLANWTVHSGRAEQHPLLEFADKLSSLLNAVVDRLSILETTPSRFGTDIATIQQILDESVALCVALSDALGLMLHTEALGTLRRAAALRHRRIACEAAAAILRLGDEHGQELLEKMASEPVARLRALNYAEELGFIESIDEQFRSEAARAESTLALWLAAPENYGIAPKHLELIDQRTLMWPSFDVPQSCYLFRFVYPLVDGQFSNIGIAGPLVHAFTADMAELPEMDIYAAFAGWQAEHAEIFELRPSEFMASHMETANGLKAALETADYTNLETFRLGSFFGDWVFVGQGTLEDAEGTVVFDGTELLWYPQSGRPRPIEPDVAYSIYKGRRFLRSFNP